MVLANQQNYIALNSPLRCINAMEAAAQVANGIFAMEDGLQLGGLWRFSGSLKSVIRHL